MVARFVSERWPASRRYAGPLQRRNGGPLRVGIPGPLPSEFADVASKETEKATQMAGMTAKIGLAAGAFVAFIMMIFVFIFVKIERNLRVLQFIAPEEVDNE